MAAPSALSSEMQATYSTIIDGILATSDLSTVSAKRVRKGLQAAVGHDVTAQKDAINSLIMARFDHFNERKNGAIAPTSDAPTTNGVKPSVEERSTSDKPPTPKPASSSPPKRPMSSELSEAPSDMQESAPKKKKRKRKDDTSEVDDDAAYARMLQAEENSRARPTRGGGAAPTKKRTPAKKKSKSKVKVDDDSDMAGASGEEKKVKRTGGFHKEFNLSPPLADMLGEARLSRPQTVSKIWAYVKERDLQAPDDKRQIRCDDAMRAVFRQDKVHMFSMNKILSNHLYPMEE